MDTGYKVIVFEGEEVDSKESFLTFESAVGFFAMMLKADCFDKVELRCEPSNNLIGLYSPHGLTVASDVVYLPVEDAVDLANGT
jgi:hypothetical protein